MTYTLYRTRDSAALAPQIIMEEGGLAYDIVEVDFRTGETQLPEYLEINPNGVVPSLACPSGQIIYETAAIMLYLADVHKLDQLAPSPAHPDRALFLRTLFHLSNNVHPLSNLNFGAARYVHDKTGLQELEQSSLDALLKSWAPIDAQLQQNGPYCLGDRFSLVDVYVFLIARWHEPAAELFAPYSGIKKCADLVAERSAVCNAIRENEPPQNGSKT